jgi:CRISPR-associated endonuclease/helicase Cas3
MARQAMPAWSGVRGGRSNGHWFFPSLNREHFAEKRLMLRNSNTIMSETLAEFFRRVTGEEVLPYQERYGVDPFRSTLLIIPTGLGKTDAVIVPWLHAIASGSPGTPRRLVIVLPRVNLTEQTAGKVRERRKTAGLDEAVDVLELMGGSSDNSERPSPERFTIIVGTQDILVSRALNRGYVRRPPRWPIDFALLNNDCLWVIDEVQLAADALATTTQLAAFRREFGVFGAVPCVWMSATVDPKWLDTVDFGDERRELRVIRLESDDEARKVVKARVRAPKRVSQAPEACRTPRGCAEFVMERHVSGERTLVVVNTVARAREVWNELRKRNCEPLLLHSRFRAGDRKRQAAELGRAGRIIVSTQVIEAGIDISANRLITDIAPWGSLVQRFGRVNRYGELAHSEIWWVDRPLTERRDALAKAEALKPRESEEVCRPYSLDEIERAVAKLEPLRSASPADLGEEDGPSPWHNVLRRADVLDLFDTSPDISGNDLDVSRFIRAGEARDCWLAWRSWKNDEDLPGLPDIADGELCPVRIGEVQEFTRAHGRDIRRWDFVNRGWVAVDARRLYPGMVVLVRADAGGYNQDEGWNPSSRQRVSPVPSAAQAPAEADGDDPLSWLTYRQSLAGHTRMVVEELRDVLGHLNGLGVEAFQGELEVAAAKHDWGKAHPVMQATLHNVAEPDFGDPAFEFLAKQKRGDAASRHARPHFRHELASALAMIAVGDSDLAAYLAAAHHGRVRVSIRSMPGESLSGGRAVARGIREGDVLPACTLAPGVSVPEVTLSLDMMDLGVREDEQPAWTDRVLRLRDELGPFRLAFLEMLLRAADERASAAKASEVSACTR